MPANNQWIPASMKKEWRGPADQPAIDAHTDALLKMQRSVEAQGSRHDSTLPNGYEDALVKIVDELSRPATTGLGTSSNLLRRFRSLARNRSRTERERQRQLHALPPNRAIQHDPAVVAEHKNLLEVARAHMPPGDWALFEERSLGRTFEEIALRTGRSPEALRQRMSRRRTALRFLIA